ncbi:hypothetical protein PMCN03_1140 [Pasteurella multocida subsp. multocida str. HB03]|nr:hypothetical protein PMCN03_1140 [Pasteurella multocida subsp. multocida str. HB03]EPC11359.1 hypothetical protein I138_00020 [Pasteurella multocida 1500E]EPE65192.1 hypothetical protein I140_08747 [Pasteurella multocida 93002]ESQ73165.1 hypothetical protein P1062_0206425 [Pasteurella multocida subsp. multocida P1062]
MGCVHCFLLKVKNGVSLEGIGEKAREEFVSNLLIEMDGARL